MTFIKPAILAASSLIFASGAAAEVDAKEIFEKATICSLAAESAVLLGSSEFETSPLSLLTFEDAKKYFGERDDLPISIRKIHFKTLVFSLPFSKALYRSEVGNAPRHITTEEVYGRTFDYCRSISNF